MPTLVEQKFSGLTQLTYLPNPYVQYGNFNMSSIPWSTPPVNNSFAYKYPDDYSQSYFHNENSGMSKGKKANPKGEGGFIFI